MADRLVTVAIPTLNGGALLEETLRAVCAQRLARQVELELVVCDSGSQDGSVKVARRHGEVLNASPEFDDCVRLAEQARVSVKDIQAAATKAWLDSRPS